MARPSRRVSPKNAGRVRYASPASKRPKRKRARRSDISRIGYKPPRRDSRSSPGAGIRDVSDSAIGAISNTARFAVSVPGAWGRVWGGLFEHLMMRIMYPNITYSCGGPIGYFSNSQSSCGIVVVHGADVPPVPVGAGSVGSNKLYIGRGIGSQRRFLVTGLWSKTGGWPNGIKQLRALPVPASVPSAFPPMLDPFPVPPGRLDVQFPPVPIPYRAVPYVRPNPARSPSERTDFGPRPLPRPRPAFRVRPARYTDEWFNQEEYRNAEKDRDSGASSNPRPVDVPRPRPRPGAQANAPQAPRDQPPGRGTKERKARTTGYIDAIRNGVGSIGEVVDVIDAIYAALPGKIRHADWRANGFKPVTTADKFQSIYRNIQQLNVPRAFINVLKSHYQDEIQGRVSRRLQKGNPGGPIDRYIQNWKTRGVGNIAFTF